MSKTKIGCTYTCNDSTDFWNHCQPNWKWIKDQRCVKKTITIGEREEISRNNNKMT